MIELNNKETNIFESKAGAGNSAENLLSLARENFNKNNFYKARFYLESLINEYPAKAEYFSALGTVYKKLGNLDEAKKYYTRAAETDPEFYEAFYNLGRLYYEQGETEAELGAYLRAIQINPDLHPAYYNIGNLFRRLEQMDKAAAYYEQAVNIKSDFTEGLYNLGVVYERTQNYEEALRCYEKVLRLNPAYDLAAWNKALLNLRLGNFKSGWDEYEIRKSIKELKIKNPAEKLLTNQDVNGKKILVYSEQGLGDNIQFFRYLRLLKERGAYVIFECNPKLYHLFEDHPCLDEIVMQKDNAGPGTEFDYQIALMSLPKFFNTRMQDIPSETSYLYAKRDKLKEWEKIICPFDELKVGIAWAGAGNNLHGKSRSCPPEELGPLFEIEGVRYFSLQKDANDFGLPAMNQPMITFKDIDDIPFLDTAAIITNLDLVVTIDTSIAHLSGALGIETLVMLPYYADWRWFTDRKDSPWYPGIKLFRQKSTNDWRSAVEGVKNRIVQKLSLREFPQTYWLN